MRRAVVFMLALWVVPSVALAHEGALVLGRGASPAPAPAQTPAAHAADARAEARAAHAKQAAEHHRAFEAEHQRHGERMKALRQDMHRVDHARDKWWKVSVRDQLAGETQRHRAWLREHRGWR